MNTTNGHPESATRSRNLYQLGKWGAIAIIAYFLLTEHYAHVVQVLPYLLLLACPLMHMFMHKGHKNHDNHPQSTNSKEEVRR